MPDAPAVYPPAHHILRDLWPTTQRFGSERVVVSAPCSPHLADESGRLLIDSLAILIDIAGAGIALGAVEPDWIATVDLAVHLTGPPPLVTGASGRLVVEATPLRIGKRLVVIDTRVDQLTDGDATVTLAVGELSFSRIPGSATKITVDTAETSEPATLAPVTPLDEPLRHRIATRIDDAAGGRLRIAHNSYISNSFGTINGGVVGALLGQAASTAAATRLGPCHVSDIHVRHLAQSRDGAVFTSAEPLRSADSYGSPSVYRARLHSESGALLATAMVSVAPKPTDGARTRA